MANRSYLYGTDSAPIPNARGTYYRGLSEWTGDVPLVYRLLLSGEPRMTTSSIWPEHGQIALLADYSRGVERLQQFLKRLDYGPLQELGFEALEFLTMAENRRTFFLLEAGERFDLDGQSELALSCRRLREEILQVDNLVDAWVIAFQNSSENARRAMVADLGFDAWSNTLYFDPNEMRHDLEGGKDLGVAGLTIDPDQIIEQLATEIDPILRDVAASDPLLLAEWPTLSIAFSGSSPESGDAEDGPRRMWNAMATFDDGEEEAFTVELLVELANVEQPLLVLSWVLFPNDEVEPRLKECEVELLRYLNEANSSLVSKFRLNEERGNTYISCELCLPAYAVDSDLIGWALNESLAIGMESFDAIDSILNGQPRA